MQRPHLNQGVQKTSPVTIVPCDSSSRKEKFIPSSTPCKNTKPRLQSGVEVINLPRAAADTVALHPASPCPESLSSPVSLRSFVSGGELWTGRLREIYFEICISENSALGTESQRMLHGKLKRWSLASGSFRTKSGVPGSSSRTSKVNSTSRERSCCKKSTEVYEAAMSQEIQAVQHRYEGQIENAEMTVANAVGARAQEAPRFPGASGKRQAFNGICRMQPLPDILYGMQKPKGSQKGITHLDARAPAKGNFTKRLGASPEHFGGFRAHSSTYCFF